MSGLSKTSLKYMEFAGKILAKSLLESTISTSSQASLPFRMSKSFLAQIIGLRVNLSVSSFHTCEIGLKDFVQLHFQLEQLNLVINIHITNKKARTPAVNLNFDILNLKVWFFSRNIITKGDVTTNSTEKISLGHTLVF